MSLLHSPLHERHEELGAKFGEFGGWSMPLDYSARPAGSPFGSGGVVLEHTAVRTGVGVFDVSHLGKAMVSGPGAAAHVNACLTNDLDRIGPGQAQYTLCCDDATGGIVDDLIAYYRDDEHVLLVPNAANTPEVVRRLTEAAPDGVSVVDHHRDYAVLAVQGPRSDELLQAVGLPAGHDYMSFVEGQHADAGVVVCRTGYTGERGYELIVAGDAAGSLWDALLAAGGEWGVVPCGLGARDTLRTEMGYPLHGQDISLDVTPNEARLGWAVGWSKPAFWGKEPLAAEKQAGPTRRLYALASEGRAIPRPHMAVSLGGADESGGETPIGEVTSGTFSPTLRKGIGLALLATTQASVQPDAEVTLDVRGRREPFRIVKLPFVDTSVRES